MNATQVVIGQRVYSGLYGGRYGIVFRIHGEQSPASVGSIAGCVSYGGSASFDIVFDNGGMSRGLPESILRGVQWKIFDKIADAEEIAKALHHAEHEEARRDAEAKAAAERRAAERKQHAENYPHLTKKSDKPDYSPGRLAAENIRKELKKAFPGFKFSVKSDYNSVDIRWSCGPTTRQVKEIVDKYKAGRFDGMSDIYEYDADSTFADVFGDPKYVSCQREYPRESLLAIYKTLADAYRVPFNGHDAVLHQNGGCLYASDVAHRILNNSPLGTTLTGIKPREEETGGAHEDMWIAY